MGSTALEDTLSNRFATEKTSLGEDITVVQIEKSDGVAWRDEAFQQHARELAIKEYFFGDARRSLSPQIQQVDFDSLIIYRVSSCMLPPLFIPCTSPPCTITIAR